MSVINAELAKMNNGLTNISPIILAAANGEDVDLVDLVDLEAAFDIEYRKQLNVLDLLNRSTNELLIRSRKESC